MQFEFDPRKSDINKAKHGIDFVEAQTLWKSKIILLGAKNISEKRYLAIGTIEGLHWSAIITYRGSAIRIISVRRSTQAEIDTYEKIGW
ncbi:MAG TPA: BrnT family toxin [Chthoniobacterales bacterium]|nr:BrnT family toxin [Chthoniobacterales bacterium]